MKFSRVVLADGHLGVMSGIHWLLEALFDSVLMVAEERSLLEALAKFEPELVVADLSLPAESGPNLAARMLENHPGLRLIVLTAYDDWAVADQLIRGGVAGVVLRRTVASDLVGAIQSVMAGGIYASPEIERSENLFEAALSA